MSQIDSYEDDVEFAKNIDYTDFDEISVRFLHLIKLQAGKKAGLDAMDALRAILGKDWAARVLYHVVADNFPSTNQVQLKGFATGQKFVRKIDAIRELRRLTDLGLKESKDIIESVEYGKYPIVELNTSDHIKVFEFLANMDNWGYQFIKV